MASEFESAAGTVTIGGWTLAVSARRLVRGDTEHVLDPKEFSVLSVLAERAPEGVSTSELMDRVWSDVVVGDNALHQVIARLRKTLGDDPRNPTYIETLTKHGYRLIAPTSVHSEPGDSERSPAQTTPRPVLKGLMVGAFVVVAAAAAAIALRTSAPSTAGLEDVVISVQPLGAPTASTAPLAEELHAEIVRNLVRIPFLSLSRQAPTTAFGYELTGTVHEPSTGDTGLTVHLSRTGRTIASHEFTSTAPANRQAQRDVARQVAQFVHTFTDPRNRDLGTASESARLALLRAVVVGATGRADGVQQMLAYTDQALQIDPSFARAHAIRGYAYRGLVNWFAIDHARGMALIRDHAAKALSSAPDEPLALLLNAELAKYDGDYKTAERNLARALRHARPSVYAADYLAHCGRFDEALAALDRELEFNPLNMHARRSRAQFLWYARRYADALASLEQILLDSPDDHRAQVLRSHVLESVGRIDEALDALPADTQLVQPDPSDPPTERLGRALLRGAQALESGGIPGTRNTAWRRYVRAYAALGNFSEAVRWLQHGWVLGDRWEFFYVRVYPFTGFDALRHHADYKALMMETIGNPDHCPGYDG